MLGKNRKSWGILGPWAVPEFPVAVAVGDRRSRRPQRERCWRPFAICHVKINENHFKMKRTSALGVQRKWESRLQKRKARKERHLKGITKVPWKQNWNEGRNCSFEVWLLFAAFEHLFHKLSAVLGLVKSWSQQAGHKRKSCCQLTSWLFLSWGNISRLVLHWANRLDWIHRSIFTRRTSRRCYLHSGQYHFGDLLHSSSRHGIRWSRNGRNA